MNYVSTVVDHLVAANGTPSILSPDDYAAIAEWEKQEIPLTFVLNCVERLVCESKEGNTSISDIQATVTREFAESLSLSAATA